MKIFEKVGVNRPKKSGFDLSHEKKLSCSMGELIPILVQEIVPGDRFKVNTEVMIRFSPMIAPVMHRVNVYVHYFFVPNRIIWDSWRGFITGGPQGTTTPVMPTIPASSATMGAGTLGDFLGVGLGTGGSGFETDVNALPFRAYQEIYNEYYRDETLTTEVDWTIDGQARTLRQRQWEKDYFTSALPWTQRGNDVTVPITFNNDGLTPDRVYQVGTSTALTGADLGTNVTGDLERLSDNVLGNLDNTNSLDLLINDLRQTSAIQRWLERQARGGYRYIETILNHFGVESSDSRLQRPEYLGGGRQPVTISEVLNTSNTATAAQGTMAGHGISVGMANRMKRRFEEHGWLFGIMSVLPRTAYQNGIHRSLLRTDKYDYYWPEFANLGEQEITNKELFYEPGVANQNDEVFGYQQRYAEMKYACSTVHGDFRNSLDYWHLGRKFTSLPSLNNDFTESDPDTRIFAVETGDTLWCQIYNNVKAIRLMPHHAKPTLR